MKEQEYFVTVKGMRGLPSFMGTTASQVVDVKDPRDIDDAIKNICERQHATQGFKQAVVKTYQRHLTEWALKIEQKAKNQREGLRRYHEKKKQEKMKDQMKDQLSLFGGES